MGLSHEKITWNSVLVLIFPSSIFNFCYKNELTKKYIGMHSDCVRLFE